MDSFNLQDDIKVVCITAKSFPEGVESAHLELQATLPYHERRRFFGISRPENGQIVYKAAAEVFNVAEGSQFGLEEFTIKSGPYNSFYLANFRQDETAIKRAFDLLTKEHEVDPDGYCLEWYIGENDVKCLVPLGPNYREFTGANNADL